MICKLDIPEHIQTGFLEAFGVPLDAYHDAFWGWLKSPLNKRFKQDFPELTPLQQQVLDGLIAFEEFQFMEFRQQAKEHLDNEERRPYADRQRRLLENQ